VRKEDILDICQRVPERDVQKIQFITVTGMQLNVESFARFEATYVVFRGREGGQTDEGRGFFVPYDEIVCMKIERSVKLSELKGLYGEIVSQELDLSTAEFPSDSAPAKTPLPAAVITPAVVKTGPVDPAQIAKQNLLARIRAARTAAGVGNNS
jgi:hypothetical protein